MSSQFLLSNYRIELTNNWFIPVIVINLSSVTEHCISRMSVGLLMLVHVWNWRALVLSIMIANIPDHWKSLSFSISMHFYHKIVIKEFIISSSLEQTQVLLTSFVWKNRKKHDQRIHIFFLFWTNTKTTHQFCPFLSI